MRSFEHMNMNGEDVCPICKKKEDKPVVLVGIDGTQKDGNIRCMQIHVDCINLLIKDIGDEYIIYQRVSK